MDVTDGPGAGWPADLPGWNRRGDQLVKTYHFDDFRSAMLFAERVADAVETVGHHPDIDIRGGAVTLAVGATDPGPALAHRVERLRASTATRSVPAW